MSKYWAKRAAEQSRKQYDKSLAELEKELSRYYRIALDSVEDDIVSLYTKILLEMKDNENVGADALYRFDRFTKLRDKIVMPHKMRLLVGYYVTVEKLGVENIQNYFLLLEQLLGQVMEKAVSTFQIYAAMYRRV